VANAVFIQNPVSIYADVPGEAYHFPRQYLGTVQSAVGDWVVVYEGRRGAFGYIDRLIRAERRLMLPDDPRHAPHPAYLRYHRAAIFGRDGL
jgi:hypothetical protein